MSEPFLGELRLVGFNFAPQGWALCNGQTLAISQNTALFSLLGTTYGGDGITTFALPNLQGRVAMHFGNGTGLTPRVQGAVGGEETVTLTVPQLPAHTHALPASNKRQTTNQVSGSVPANGGFYGVTADANASAAPTASTGSSQPHDNLQPYLVLNYIIALQGIFPSRS